MSEGAMGVEIRSETYENMAVMSNLPSCSPRFLNVFLRRRLIFCGEEAR